MVTTGKLGTDPTHHHFGFPIFQMVYESKIINHKVQNGEVANLSQDSLYSDSRSLMCSFPDILTELQFFCHSQNLLKFLYTFSMLPQQIISILTQQVLLELVHNGGKS